MISYELAKKLKDASFPQTGGVSYCLNCEEARDFDADAPNCCQNSSEEGYMIPTLSELIEACGRFTLDFGLEHHSNDWRAGTLKTGGVNVVATGSTPEEAVANLWLALNTK